MGVINYTSSAAPFVVQPQLTALTIAYQNERMIADDVLPRVPVAREDFKYSTYTREDTFTIPDTKVGRKSKPNEIDWSATEAVASVRAYGLEEAIPQSDIDNANGTPINPEMRATEQLTDTILLDREQRAANLVFNANSYATANKTTLASTTQWSDFANSDPIGAILSAMDTMIMRPNTLVLGRATLTKLITHPKILQAFHGNQGSSGIVQRQFLASLFELDNVIVGEGWVNTAKKGQTGTMARLWGKHASLLYVKPVSADTQSMTFGVTAQFGSRIAGRRPDPDIGLKGGVRVRVGEEVKELILANDLGYFFQNAVA